MRNVNLLVILFSIFLFGKLNASSSDTLNYVDENNMKQGYWVYTNNMKKLPNYKANQVIEKGRYANDKKTGKWVFYYNNDKVKQILNYLNNRPNGHAVFYYKNGNKRDTQTTASQKKSVVITKTLILPIKSQTYLFCVRWRCYSNFRPPNTHKDKTYSLVAHAQQIQYVCSNHVLDGQ